MTDPRPLHIAVFHLGFFYSGGGKKLVLEQVRWLRDRGHSVEVYAPIVDPVKCFPELIADVGPHKPLRRAPDLFGVGDGLTRHHHHHHHDHHHRYVVYLSQPNRLLPPRAIDRDASSQVICRDFHLLSTAANLGTRRPARRHPCTRRRRARSRAYAATRRCAQPGCPRGRRSTLLTTRTNGHPWARAV